MRKVKFAALFSLILALAIGCDAMHGSGRVIREVREMGYFNQVSFSGIGQLIVTQGDRESVVIEAEDNLIADLRTEIANERLVIGFQAAPPIPTRPIVVTLSLKDLISLELAGVGSIQADRLQAEDLKLEVSGTGTLEIAALNADRLTVSGSGAGDIEVSGEVSTQQVALSGAGQYKASDLKSQMATIDIGGIGNAIVWATQYLAVNLSGVGSVAYYGSPRVVQEISGIGSIESLGNPQSCLTPCQSRT